MYKFIHTYDSIITLEKLLYTWQKFHIGKSKKLDVILFEAKLIDNLISLQRDLTSKTYHHSTYTAFKINDPKPRDIHKSSVKDRVIHHAVYRVLYPYFDTKFIYDSYSCRIGKGTHKAITRYELFGRKVSQNNTKQCFVLKCDIKKFFASINHDILKSILEKHIVDKDILNLLFNIIDSFNKGLPLGNLTSQLLVNIYMNEFDQYMKHELKVKYYIRYADDFVVLHQNKEHLKTILLKISEFLENKLKLKLHPNKVYIKSYSSGVDFLGWLVFPCHKVLRTSTKKRMFRNLEKNDYKRESVESYRGMLKWGDGYEMSQGLEN